jgi:NADPH:quinone reductase-like Zn-dependent oxidoreductase
MRAVAVSDFAAVPELMDVPAPSAGAGQVLVRLRAASYNPFDLKAVDGILKDVVPHRFPMILGTDGAGEVEMIGEGVTGFRPGERVYGQFLHLARGLGSYAEYGVVDAAGPLAKMPEGMLFEQAAAVPTASMTAHTLIEAARVDEGQTVLIVGATGGVGQSAIQLAADQGAAVIATAPADEADVLRYLGAAETVDHTAGPVADQVLAAHPNGVDAVLDLVSPPDRIASVASVVRPGGAIASTIGALDPDTLAAREIRAVNVQTAASGRLLGILADMVDSDRLRIRIQAQVPLADTPALLKDIRTAPARGKTVITI